MLKMRLFISAISAVFAVTPCIAQQQEGAQAQGIGQQSVSDQIRLQEQTSAAGTPIHVSTAGVRQIQQALNRQGFDVGDVDGIWSKATARGVANYQRSRDLEPTGTLTVATINSLGLQNVLTGALKARGDGNQRWRQEQAKGPGTVLRISPAGVRQLQQALNKRGYDAGHVDGIWGGNTATAAANFQKARGLEPTGKPDVDLIAALGITQDIFSAGAQAGKGNMRWTEETAIGPGVPLWASPASVRQIQQRLNRAGYDTERVDGQWSEQTARAAQNYQRANGLEPTGTLTTSLLNSLGDQHWMQSTAGGSQTSGGQGEQQQRTGSQDQKKGN